MYHETKFTSSCNYGLLRKGRYDESVAILNLSKVACNLVGWWGAWRMVAWLSVGESYSCKMMNLPIFHTTYYWHLELFRKSNLAMQSCDWNYFFHENINNFFSTHPIQINRWDRLHWPLLPPMISGFDPRVTGLVCKNHRKISACHHRCWWYVGWDFEQTRFHCCRSQTHPSINN